eukprot:233705-Prymnesium_polylepis.1
MWPRAQFGRCPLAMRSACESVARCDPRVARAGTRGADDDACLSARASRRGGENIGRFHLHSVMSVVLC